MNAKTSLFITRQQLADRWGLSKESVKRMERKGLVNAIKLAPRVVRYNLGAIEAYEAAATLDRKEVQA